jgi:hypothetical protein
MWMVVCVLLVCAGVGSRGGGAGRGSSSATGCIFSLNSGIHYVLASVCGICVFFVCVYDKGICVCVSTHTCVFFVCVPCHMCVSLCTRKDVFRFSMHNVSSGFLHARLFIH